MAKSYSAAELTRMQELGSAWIFRRVLNDNQTYNSPDDIIKDKKYVELVKIYPAINAEWLKAFHAQQKTMFKEFSASKFIKPFTSSAPATVITNPELSDRRLPA